MKVDKIDEALADIKSNTVRVVIKGVSGLAFAVEGDLQEAACQEILKICLREASKPRGGGK